MNSRAGVQAFFEEIVAVESVLHHVSYGMGFEWSTWEEVMSSLPRLR